LELSRDEPYVFLEDPFFDEENPRSIFRDLDDYLKKELSAAKRQ